MFIYLVASVATLVFIFGLFHVKHLDNWLRSSIHSSLTLYNGLICRPAIQTTLNNENSEGNLTTEGSVVVNDIVEEFLTQKTVVSNNERLSETFLRGVGSRSKNLNLPRYSLEDIVPEEKDKDTGLPVKKTHQLEITQDSTIRINKQEGKENIFESLKSSVEKFNYPSSLLNSQIYNLILKETQKESETRQKLFDSDNKKINESSSTEV
ncbi:hypothetical protein K0M31_005236 [Melipona bicolor]|uniref:Uncharacterized protein n=1 Tax=Melipona bicolor TaxID=60889 RepID=A0AA40KMJ3_9HYME|nr:hypothetical protein K0M31_005236 [Melipona bicolor]